MIQPHKHHFLPVFYLKQWTGNDGRLVQFSKPYDRVVPNKRHPEATGYVRKLYTIEGLPDPIANELEREFLSPVDSRAAEALRIMLDAKRVNTFSEAQRLAWTSFLNSLLARMPDDLRKLRKALDVAWWKVMPELEKVYQEYRPESAPGTLDELFNTQPESFRKGAVIRAVRRMIAHEGLTKGLASMHWRIRTFERNALQLLTSDRPVVYTNTLGHAESHLLVPIGPYSLFVAVQKSEFADRLAAVPDDQMIKEMNKHVVENAIELVYGRDDSQIRFIQNRLGQNRAPTVIDRLLEIQANMNLSSQIDR